MLFFGHSGQLGQQENGAILLPSPHLIHIPSVICRRKSQNVVGVFGAGLPIVWVKLASVHDT